MILFYIYCVYFLWAILVCISSWMAVETGRNVTLWGGITFFLTPIVAIAFLWVLGETEEVKQERMWRKKIKNIMGKQREELRRDWEELEILQEKLRLRKVEESCLW